MVLFFKKELLLFFLAIALLSVGGCGDSAKGGSGCGSAGDPSLIPGDPQSEYVIGPGDLLSISVNEAPRQSVNDLPVRPDGRISVPLVPDIVAAGKTPAQLGHEIELRLKKYVLQPMVTVMLRSFQGSPDRQVKVVGAAAEPQTIPYRANMTLLDVMIATKGMTKFAAGNSAVIVRRVPGGQQRIPVHLSDLVKDGDLCANVAMRPGDTLIIPQSWF